MLNKNNENKILSFNQPAEFFLRKAEKHIDAGNLLEALQLYRQVLGTDPKNVEYLLCIAQVYSEMGLFSESNDVLFKITRYGETPTECLFALGCNYMGMKNYALADEAFEQYLMVDPNGEFAEDIDELFMILDEEEISQGGVLHDLNRRHDLDKAYEGKAYLDKGDYKSAIKYLEESIRKSLSMCPAMNNLALAYFFDGNKTKAIEISKEVLLISPLNLHAFCNLALFYSDSNDHARAAQYLSKIDNLSDIEPEDMHKVALTYCELGYHDKAYVWFIKLLAFHPFDIRILHFCGLAAYNFGKYSESFDCFLKILKIDPGNSLASYYKEKAKRAKQIGAANELEYVYQVQFDEIKKRIKYLNECLKQKDDSLENKWQKDDYFKSIILWGLNFGDEYIKKIVLEIMSIFSDKRVEEEFRSFLLKSAETDEIKNDVFMYLKRMNAKEPYVAYIKGAISEVRVGSVSEEINNLPEKYIETLKYFIKNTRDRYSDDFVTTGVELMATIARERKDNGVWIKRPAAFAAALEYCVCNLLENINTPRKKELAQIYGANLDTLNRYCNKIYGLPKEGVPDAD